MYPFKAYRAEGQVIINGEHHYRQGEILRQLLNMDFEKLREKYVECLGYEATVRYPIGGGDYDYNKVVYHVQGFFNLLDLLTAKLPPYDKILKPEDMPGNLLFKLLSTQPALFKRKGNKSVKAYDSPPLVPNDDDLDDYALDDTSDHERRYFQNQFRRDFQVFEYPELNRFVPDWYDDNVEPLAVELNKRITQLYDTYMTFATEILRVPYLYTDLLDNYIHVGGSLQEPTYIARAYQKSLDDREEYARRHRIHPYQRMAGAWGMAVTHEVFDFTDEHGKIEPRLWQITEHGGLGSFLYSELFEGLRTGWLPKRCHNCGRYFLLTTGYGADFCENPAPGQEEKTCRDVGARRRYDEKVKNDPVWLAYQRAYKTHYARVSKRKMTKPEFAAWSEKAIQLRSLALEGKMAFEEYTRALRR